MSSNVVKHKSRKIGYMKFSVIDLVKNCFICFSHCVIVHCKDDSPYSRFFFPDSRYFKIILIFAQ